MCKGVIVAVTEVQDWNEVFQRVWDYTASGEFPPHAFCLTYNDNLISLMMVSDLIIGFSYFLIAVVIFWRFERIVCLLYGRYIPVMFHIRMITMMFAAFVISCGIGHFIDVWNLFSGMYWMKAWWNTMTAFLSIMSASSLLYILGWTPKRS